MNMMAKLFCVACMVLCAACDSGTTSENGDGNTVGVPGKVYDDSNVKDVPIAGGYSYHKFVGEDDRITRETAVQDVNYYLNKAESYVKGLGNGFNNPEKFQTLVNSLKNTNNYNVNGYDGARKMDTLINAFKPCEDILVNVITNLGGYYGDVDKNYCEREAFEMCYRVLANEAYYEAYGDDRNNVKSNYEYKKNQLIAGWSQEENKFLTANLISVYNNKNFTTIANNIDTLLRKAVPKMGVTTADLRKVVNIALAGESLHAMHDLTSNALNHKQETLTYNPNLQMQREINTLYREERNKYQDMSYGL